MIIIKCSTAEHLFNLRYFPNIFWGMGLLAPHSPQPERINLSEEMLQSIIEEFERSVNNQDRQQSFYDEHAVVIYEKKWAEMRRQYKEYFRKHGYIPVRFDETKADFEVVVPSVGRPIAPKSKQVIKNIRIDDAMNQMLDDYCKANKVSASELIRKALQEFFSKQK
jgi:hypothetical protein